MSLLSYTISIKVGIDIYTKVNLVNINLVWQLGLKPCWNENLPILQAINQQDLHTYRAYNLCLELTDTYGIRKTTLRPYLAIDYDLDNS